MDGGFVGIIVSCFNAVAAPGPASRMQALAFQSVPAASPDLGAVDHAYLRALDSPTRRAILESSEGAPPPATPPPEAPQNAHRQTPARVQRRAAPPAAASCTASCRCTSTRALRTAPPRSPTPPPCKTPSSRRRPAPSTRRGALSPPRRATPPPTSASSLASARARCTCKASQSCCRRRCCRRSAPCVACGAPWSRSARSSCGGSITRATCAPLATPDCGAAGGPGC